MLQLDSMLKIDGRLSYSIGNEERPPISDVGFLGTRWPVNVAGSEYSVAWGGYRLAILRVKSS